MNTLNLAKKATVSFQNQKQRCYNKKNKNYSTYGARGIKVEYSLKEYVQWFVAQYSKISIENDVITCGRIDHSKSYSFDNICLQGRRENTKETHTRLPNPGILRQKKVVCTNFNTGEILYEANGTRDAAKFAKCSQAIVVKCCKNETSHTRDWISFKYKGEKPKEKQKIKIAVINRATSKVEFLAVTFRHAARYAKTTKKTVSEHCRGLVVPYPKLKYTFKYVED